MSTAKDLLAPYAAHVDDPEACRRVLDTLHAIHGPDYIFRLSPFKGLTTLVAPGDRLVYWFIVQARNASLALSSGDRVRGAPPDGPFRALEGGLATATDSLSVPLWPGDVIAVGPDMHRTATIIGTGLAFAVHTGVTEYIPPKAVFLRHLPDRPGGCASYAGAFRREALPPLGPDAQDPDRRGPNRLNEHTLDMRIDRQPPPSAHHHGPVPIGPGRLANHTETAIVLPRAVYGLPEVDRPDAGWVILHPDPLHDPGLTITAPVEPGSILVTPATTEQVWGHRFENCFAMLVAIPGFVAPSHPIEGDSST